ncbi:hypothetical protein [Streptococcus oralis]|uniref:Uncharacterized protein n=1 Tax=Streptococcus oralis TaxID=1303 RepID=A0A139PGC1_STROR|nr:hypothetical protein [Streptococcus oralis]KXT88323.1 hypothetical protein SORDD16_00116 [Streptococcus oralis]
MDYQLLPHEYMVMHDDHVSFGKSTGSTDDLILTNLHLILIKKGFFGGKKGELKIPINQIKVFEGKPQVLVNKDSGLKCLEVYYTGGQASFSFSNPKDTDKWANNIIKLMAGDTENFEKIGDSSLFGVDILAESLKDTFDTFKTGLGFKDAEPEKVSTKCSFCGAPLSGVVKQAVKCSYCDMEQTL